MTIPGTSREIIKALINEFELSVRIIARGIEAAPKTIYEILNGNPTHPQTDLGLIHFYLKLKFSSELNNEKNKQQNSTYEF